MKRYINASKASKFKSYGAASGLLDQAKYVDREGVITVNNLFKASYDDGPEYVWKQDVVYPSGETHTSEVARYKTIRQARADMVKQDFYLNNKQ